MKLQTTWITMTCLAAMSFASVNVPELTPEEKAAATSTAPGEKPKVVLGTDKWVFLQERRAVYDKESEGPGKAADVILDFHKQLKAAGIHLAVVPIPEQLYLAREHWPEKDAAFTRAHLDKAYESLRSKGVDVVDAPGVLEKLRATGTKTALTRDTHLTAAAYEALAEVIAADVHKNVKLEGRPQDFSTLPFEATEPAWMEILIAAPPEKIVMNMNRVKHRVIKLAVKRQGAEVMIMGDSHVTQYAEENASLADHIARFSGLMPDVRCRQSDGAAQTIRTDLARQRDNLEGTRVVVWVFYEGAMVLEAWKKIDVMTK